MVRDRRRARPFLSGLPTRTRSRLGVGKGTCNQSPAVRACIRCSSVCASPAWTSFSLVARSPIQIRGPLPAKPTVRRLGQDRVESVPPVALGRRSARRASVLGHPQPLRLQPDPPSCSGAAHHSRRRAELRRCLAWDSPPQARYRAGTSPDNAGYRARNRPSRVSSPAVLGH